MFWIFLKILFDIIIVLIYILFSFRIFKKFLIIFFSKIFLCKDSIIKY